MHTRLLIALALTLLATACNHADAGAAQQTNAAAPPASALTTGPATHSAKAAPASTPAPAKKQPPVYTNFFNGGRAWEDMKAQLAFGYRVAGSPAANKCRGYLIGELKQTCASVDSQLFSVKRPNGDLRMCNIIGHINPQAPRRILLIGHWDTRPTADMNPQGERNKPIVGADDGASEVAVLLELARVFKDHPPKVGVDILLTDGEDYGPSMTMMFLGAKYYADHLTQEQIDSYSYGILLDMIGDSDLDIHPEANSEPGAARVFQAALTISRDLGYKAFRENGELEILDDHLPLVEKGIRVYDFIDFNYRYWHTTNDTLDKCSSESLEAVGRTVENMVYITPNLYGPDEKLASNTIGGGWR